MRLLDTGDEQNLGELFLSSYEFDLHIGPHLIVAVMMNQSGRFCCPSRTFFLGRKSVCPQPCCSSPWLWVVIPLDAFKAGQESEDRMVYVMCFHPLWMKMDQSFGF